MAYRLPGISINIVNNPANAQLPPGLRIPCIVATGLTTQPVKNVAVTRGSGSFDTITGAISSSGVGAINGTVSSITFVGDFPDLSQYKPGVDFAQVDNQIQWLGGQSPALNATYYLTYATPKPASFYNKGILYQRLGDVINDCGPALIGGVLNPITAAAKLCFDNGAQLFMVIQSLSGSQSDLETAIDAAKQQDIDVVVVPQSCNTTLDNYVKAHVLGQSSPSVRHERVWYRSSDGMSDAVTTVMAAAQGMLHERVTVMAPPAFVTTLHDSVYNQDSDILLPSGYLAAAYAGTTCDPDDDAATPLTRKSFVGVKSLSTFNYTSVDKLNLGGAGVTVVESNKGAFRVMQALTTDTTNVDNASQSLVFIKDNVRKSLRQLLDSSFIGSKIDSSLASRVAAAIDSFCSQKVREGIIKAFQNISVVQDQIDPRTLNVTLAIAPIFPLEYVDVTISLFV